MEEFPFEEVEISEAEVEKLFAKGNRRGKIWNKEKLLEKIQEAKIHHWTLDQFAKEFSNKPDEFSDEKDLKKSIKRFLRRALKEKAKYEVSDDGVVIYTEQED